MKPQAIRKLLFCACAMVFIATLVSPCVASPSYKLSKRSFKDLSSQRQKVHQRLKDLKIQSASLSEQVKELDAQLATLENGLDAATERMKTKQKQIAEAGEHLRELEKELAQRKSLLAERATTVYMQGESSYLNLLFNADSFREFINRAYYLNLIFEADKGLIQSIDDKSAEVEQEKQNLEVAVSAIAGERQKLTEQKQAIAAARRDKGVVMRAVEQDVALTEQEYQVLMEESRRISQFLRSSSSYSGKWTGRFLKPTMGSITSSFGKRIHPITHKLRMHNGVDISSPYGTPIRVGGDGKVIFAGYDSGYGNYIIVDHGGGLATLYAHCSRFAAGVGVIVKAGQTIAYVGSTGLSTGPHVHFEVHVHGEPVNPLGKM